MRLSQCPDYNQTLVKFGNFWTCTELGQVSVELKPATTLCIFLSYSQFRNIDRPGLLDFWQVARLNSGKLNSQPNHEFVSNRFTDSVVHQLCCRAATIWVETSRIEFQI